MMHVSLSIENMLLDDIEVAIYRSVKGSMRHAARHSSSDDHQCICLDFVRSINLPIFQKKR
jgi:hypothetical protein